MQFYLYAILYTLIDYTRLIEIIFFHKIEECWKHLSLVAAYMMRAYGFYGANLLVIAKTLGST